MKLREVFRFEVAYQARRLWTWLYFAALGAVSLQVTLEAYTQNARDGGYHFNGPFVIVSVTLLASVMGLLATAGLAGDAAARDVQTRMHPLVYAAPVGKGSYLGGRFLAAFVLNAGVLVAAQAALLLSAVMPGVPPELLGPFRPGAYLGAFALVALPNAFVATALLFALAVLTRRAILGYAGALVLFFLAMFAYLFVAGKAGRWELAKLMDPLGMVVLAEISRTTTAAQKNALAMAGNGSLLLNRGVWLGVACAALVLTHLRFRFAHPAEGGRDARAEADAAPAWTAGSKRAASVVPRAARGFRGWTRVRQTLAVARQSFREIALGWGGLVLAALSVVLVVFGPQTLAHLGVPRLPTTRSMTDFVGNTGEILWTVVPLLTVFYAGELVWRDRETGVSEISDAAPVPDWSRLLGRLLGLAGVLAAYQALLVAACMLIQAQLGYHRFEPGLYLRIMLGLQLTEHLLFAALALAVHVLVDHKYVGHLVLVAAYALTAFAPALGIERHLLVYGGAPAWEYSDLRGFGPSLAPWAWLKLYWGAWALLLAVAARLFWVRGRETGFAPRLRLARRRLVGPTLGAGVAAAALAVGLGGFVFYNTDVLNAHETAADRAARRAEYERRYGRYAAAPQPRIARTALRVEIHPGRGEAEIRGTYTLVNPHRVAIDSLHLATDREVETGPAQLDRLARLVLDDRELGHRVYALAAPLLPGDSLRVRFALRFRPRGFTGSGVDPSVAANGTFFEGGDWLPAIGYQRELELTGAGERREHGLPPRRAVRPLHDAEARLDVTAAGRVAFEAVVGTDAGQVAVAPGALRRSWTENGRSYFHYATDLPIRNDFAIYSARYAVREARWNDVSIQVFYHPGHAGNVARIVRSVQASLAHLTRELGPYPHRQLRLVEHPGESPTLHAAPVNVSYQEGFALLRPEADPRRIDFPFAVVAHEVAHQWWGNQLSPADVEGAPLLTESLAWYSALGVVRETHGEAHLGRLLGMMRESYLDPRSRADVPLLRSYSRFVAYRKGPLAMHALREYVGEARVNAALRRLLREHGAGEPPLPTSLDLYRELRAAAPDSLRPLLADLFERNTFWELETRRAAATPAEGGAWRVTLDVKARKVVVDTAGAETEMPMDDLVEIGVYGPAADGGPGEPLYRRMHRVRSGEQRITVTVPGRPASAGIDPRNLLIDVEPYDNVAEVARAGAVSRR